MKTVLRTFGGNCIGLVCVIASICAVTLPGCQSGGTRLIRDNSGPFAQNNSAMVSMSAEEELAEARRMVRTGEHSSVIPRLMSLIAQYPDTEAGRDAWYFLGLTYYKIDGLQNARQSFNKYLELAPEGKYAALSRDYVAGIDAAGNQRNADRAALEARVAKYDGVSDPEELATHLELANVYWNNSEYEKAGVVYTKILKAWPSLKDDAIIRQRMELGPDGNYVVLTPAEVERRYAETDPLAIFNTQSWRSPRFWREDSDRNGYYNVSGQVANRGKTPLRDSSVIVTIFSLTGRVYDSQTYHVGPLRPGESRAFSVRFSNFDNIENVHRYECVGTYLR